MAPVPRLDTVFPWDKSDTRRAPSTELHHRDSSFPPSLSPDVSPPRPSWRLPPVDLPAGIERKPLPNLSMAAGDRPRKRLRSQYPSTDPEPHVEFILVAHFNIDSGSVMEHQYPSPVSGNESMLAELMLPEGVHARSQDWTTFFLHKDSEEPASPDGSERRRSRASTMPDLDDELFDPVEGPPLVYVLNHVNTKHDSSVKRGAIVKAMAVCTRHPFLDIYKPLLVLAIEEYFKSPTMETLAELYESLNAMDISLIPRLSMLEAAILQQSNSRELFINKFERMIEQQREDAGSPNAVSDRALALDRRPLLRDTHEYESRIFYRGHSVPVKIPVARVLETVGSFSVIKLIQTFSNFGQGSPPPFSPCHPHITTSGSTTHPIIALVNALLTQKRVMFLGANRPSEEVAEAVLAACCMASGGVLRGFTRHAFPYTDLTKIEELQKVPGFIAGVTNPIFANRDDWWDVLCDLSTGRVTISKKIEPPVITEGWTTFTQQNPTVVNAALAYQGMPGSSSNNSNQHFDYTGDVAFMSAVATAMKNRLGESVVRSMWRDWIIKLTRIAAAFEEVVYGASALYIGLQADGNDAATDKTRSGKPESLLRGHGYVWPNEQARQRELAGNVSRIEGWRQTRSYFNYKQDLMSLYQKLPIKHIDLFHQHDLLRLTKMSPDASANIYLGLETIVKTSDEICQLLTVTNEGHGGLFYIAMGLFHPRTDVREKTIDLLNRIQSHEAGRYFWDRLGGFEKLSFLRQSQSGVKSPQASAGQIRDEIAVK